MFVTNDNRQPPNFRFVKPWHVVLADTHAREERTTHATEILRQVKEEFKERFKNKKKAVWKPLAREAFRNRLQKEYPDESERGLVLVRCTEKATDRIREANTHGFEGDGTPLYGLAKADLALNVFLDNRDPPTLKNELRRHMSPAMANSFFKTVAFFQERLEDAENGDIIAKKLLKSLKPINTLRHLWNELDSSKTDVYAGERQTMEITEPHRFKDLVKYRLKLFGQRTGQFTQQLNRCQTPRKRPYLPAEKIIAFESTAKLMEMKLKEESPVSRQTQNYVITSPGISLDDLKQSLDKQWRKLNPRQDESTCSTSDDTRSEDGFGLHTTPMQVMNNLSMAEQASGHQPMDIPKDSLSSCDWNEPMSPQASFDEEGKFVDTACRLDLDQDLMYQGKTLALYSGSHQTCSEMSPTSQTLTVGGASDHKSMEGSIFLDDLMHQSWTDSGKLPMSLSGHSCASHGSKEILVASEHSEYCEIVDSVPARSKTLEDHLRVHYKIPSKAARSIATEAMRLVQPLPGVLFDRILVQKCMEIAEERGFLENSKPVERKATGHRGIEWFPTV